MNELFKKRMEVEVPTRCTVHEVVKGSVSYNEEVRCLFCKYYTKDLLSAKCEPCLSSVELINFQIDESYKEAKEKWINSHRKNIVVTEKNCEGCSYKRMTANKNNNKEVLKVCTYGECDGKEIDTIEYCPRQ